MTPEQKIDDNPIHKLLHHMSERHYDSLKAKMDEIGKRMNAGENIEWRLVRRKGDSDAG